jgi:Ca2+-transporting ATPase
MSELARYALVVVIAACVLVPLLGVLRGQPARDMLLNGLTLAFATIPELPILVTALVALGGSRFRPCADEAASRSCSAWPCSCSPGRRRRARRSG